VGALTASRYIYAVAALLQYKVICGLKYFNKLNNCFHTRLVGTLLSAYYSNLGPRYTLLNSIYIGYLVKA
jgi:hypothetical protein